MTVKDGVIVIATAVSFVCNIKKRRQPVSNLCEGSSMGSLVATWEGGGSLG